MPVFVRQVGEVSVTRDVGTPSTLKEQFSNLIDSCAEADFDLESWRLVSVPIIAAASIGSNSIMETKQITEKIVAVFVKRE